MGDDERRRHDLETEHALRGRLLDAGTGQGAQAAAPQIGGDSAQDLGEVGTGAAARIEDVDVVGREPLGDVEIVLQRLVDPGHHVADHLGRRVPDAQLPAQLWIERLEERLVEVRHRFALAKTGEERGPVDAVEGRRGPIEHVDEAERLQAARVGYLLEQRPQDRRAQMPHRRAPVERPGRSETVRALLDMLAADIGTAVDGPTRGGGGARPQDPRREHTVEQRLHQGRAEETRAAVALEADAERLFERRLDGGERRRFAGRLDAGEAVARIRGEQPREVLRLGDRRAVRQRPAEILAQTGAGGAGEALRGLQEALELVAAGEAEGLEHRLPVLRVGADQLELAQVGHQHQAVAPPVAAHLFAHRRRPRAVARRLHLDDAALGGLAAAGPAPLHLPRRVEAEVGMAGPLVGELGDAEHLRPKRRADGVQQVRERPVARPLAGRAARRPDPPQLRQIGLDGGRELRVRLLHARQLWHAGP